MLPFRGASRLVLKLKSRSVPRLALSEYSSKETCRRLTGSRRVPGFVVNVGLRFNLPL